MSQRVLMTGSYGRCGTAIIDHLSDRADYEWTYLNRSDRPSDHAYGDFDTVVANISDYEAIRPAFDSQDAINHLAANPYTDGEFSDILEPNIVGLHNSLEAAKEAEVETFVFGSTNHVMGMYEVGNAPEIYDRGAELRLDHTDPVRPDSFYGASKSFGEDLARYYVEHYEYPRQVYVLRICSVRMPEADHPYGDAEANVADGEYARESPEYARDVARMEAMWQSRRDFAHMVDCCLQDDDVEYDVFYGVSDNERRWFDIDHARDVLGYTPRDAAEGWDAPPDTASK